MYHSLIFLLCSIIAYPAQSSSSKQIEYRFTVTDAAHHLGQIDITFPQVQTKYLDLKLPVWRTGRYEILDLSKAVSQFSATDNNGNPISWQKTDKNTWKLLLNQPGIVHVKYQIYANSLKQRVIHIDPTHAYLDASGVFMFAPSFRDQSLNVKLNVPEIWQSRSGLERISAHGFMAKDYDQLVDSPIETGIHEYLTFDVEDKIYEIVIWGQGNHDIADLKEQITLLHYEAKNIWQDFPFDRYVYIYHVGDGLRGATEHVNSTIIQQKRFNFKPRKSYLKVLATTSHEFVHTWNVKAYRPAGIAPYNYSNENYSDLYWMAEGITSYYDDLLLMRAGIYQPKEYLEKLADNIQNHLENPGRKVESLAQTSFDTWLKEDAQHNHNHSVSIYLEGSLVAWRLDQEIRKITDNKYGLDQLQKRLYQLHSNIETGYQKHDVLNILNEITGKDLSYFWSDYVEGTKAIDFNDLLNFYGLQMVAPEDQSEQQTKAWIGADLNLDKSLVTVNTVSTNSPSWQAGLTAGDELLAIDGIKLSTADAQQRIELLNINQVYQLQYFRAGKLLSTEINPMTNPIENFKIKPVDKPSRKQKARFKAWAGQPLDP